MVGRLFVGLFVFVVVVVVLYYRFMWSFFVGEAVVVCVLGFGYINGFEFVLCGSAFCVDG